MTDPTSQQYVALPGSERQLVPGAHAVGPVDPNEVIQLTIRVRSRGSAMICPRRRMLWGHSL